MLPLELQSQQAHAFRVRYREPVRVLDVSEEVPLQTERGDPPEEEAQAAAGQRGRHDSSGPHHSAASRGGQEPRPVKLKFSTKIITLQ